MANNSHPGAPKPPWSAALSRVQRGDTSPVRHSLSETPNRGRHCLQEHDLIRGSTGVPPPQVHPTLTCNDSTPTFPEGSQTPQGITCRLWTGHCKNPQHSRGNSHHLSSEFNRRFLFLCIFKSFYKKFTELRGKVKDNFVRNLDMILNIEFPPYFPSFEDT